MRYATIKKRRDFLKVRDGGKYQARRSFVIQYFSYKTESSSEVMQPEIRPPEFRLGVTATKRIGNAVKRNRCKRRLRGLVRKNKDRVQKILTHSMDIVLIARYTTPDIDYATMEKEFIGCLSLLEKET